MQTEKIDAKRLKMVKTALIKLREAINLIDSVNINDGVNYSRPILCITMREIDGENRFEVHLNSVETLMQIAGSCKYEDGPAGYVSAYHEVGKLKLFTLFDKEEVQDVE